MATGLSVSNVINVTVDLAPTAAPYRNFGVPVVIGSSGVIDTSERLREYSGVDSVANDFGTTAPEYLAAALFFDQSPKPNRLYIGEWAQSATAGILRGGVLSAAERLISAWTSITTGSMKVTIDGTLKTLTTLNFSAVTNLNGVASIITTALAGAGTVVWNSVYGRFELTSLATGTSSTVSYATANTSGTDISALLKMTTGRASPPVAGIAAETLLSCVQTLADKSSAWYCATTATSTPPSDSDHIAVAAYIEASGRSRMYGITTTATTALDSSQTSDLPSSLAAAKYKKTYVQYSSFSPYAAVSMFGRAATVNYEGSDTTITLMFKQEPGVVAETITESQAATLKVKNVNVFVNYDNDTAILQHGVMCSGHFFDEIHGTDWLQNAVQTDLFDVLYTSKKVPQTDKGNNRLVNVIEDTLGRSVTNGLVAPGVWNADGFGQLSTGDSLTKGFYVYCPPVASQSQASRDTRASVPIQIAAKLAGAIHSADVTINVNR